MQVVILFCLVVNFPQFKQPLGLVVFLELNKNVLCQLALNSFLQTWNPSWYTGKGLACSASPHMPSLVASCTFGLLLMWNHSDAITSKCFIWVSEIGVGFLGNCLGSEKDSEKGRKISVERRLLVENALIFTEKFIKSSNVALSPSPEPMCPWERNQALLFHL